MMNIPDVAMPSMPSVEDLGLPLQFAAPGRRKITTGSDLTQRVGELVNSIEALLKTNTVEAIIELAREMGLQEQINSGVDLLTRIIDEIHTFFGSFKETLLHVGSLAGLIDLLEPLVAGLEGLARTSADSLKEAGLGQLAGVLQPAGKIFDKGQKVLAGGGQALQAVPSWDEVEKLGQKLTELSKTIAAYKG